MVFSISAYGRPISAHRSASTASLCRTVTPPSGMSNTLHASAYRATSRRVLRSPAPPISTRGRRTGAARHRTLRALVEWSFGLLDDAERESARRLAVFSGGATAEAVDVFVREGLLDDAGAELGRASRELRRNAERAVREWQSEVLDMVRTQGQDKRTTARFLAFGVNGLSVALMIVVFSYSYGLTGAEVGIAGGSAVLGQKLLEAVFGDQAVRSLAERARKALEARVRELFAGELARYTDLVDSLALDPDSPEQLRRASRRVEDARYAGQRTT